MNKELQDDERSKLSDLLTTPIHVKEAKIMADAGITDILIATNIIGAARSGRLAALQRRTPLKICADNPFSINLYSEAGRAAERPVSVVIECDTGQKRSESKSPLIKSLTVILPDLNCDSKNRSRSQFIA